MLLYHNAPVKRSPQATKDAKFHAICIFFYHLGMNGKKKTTKAKAAKGPHCCSGAGLCLSLLRLPFFYR